MTSTIMRGKQAWVWKQLTAARSVSPAVTVLCEYLSQKIYPEGHFDDYVNSTAEYKREGHSRPRSCLELSTTETADAGIVGTYSAASFQIPELKVAGLLPRNFSNPSDGSTTGNGLDWIQKNLDDHRNLLGFNVTTDIVAELDWDDEEQIQKVKRLASPIAPAVVGYDWILVANNEVTHESLCHQPLADLIADLLRQNPAHSATSSSLFKSKCFVAHQESGSFNLRGYDPKLAEFERALLRAGLVTVDVSHHQHSHESQHKGLPVELATTCDQRIRRRRLSKSTRARPCYHKNSRHSSNRVCILEIESARNNQTPVQGGTGTALWRKM